MSTNVFDAFGPLDDLIQVIYQASHRFVVLSRVDFDAPLPSWQIYLGLADIGKWWRGRWEEKDVHVFVGKNVSMDLLETFADNVAKAVMQGDLFVGGMGSTTESSAEMKMVFNPNGPNNPLSIPLTELSAHETIVFMTNEMFSLGLSAQKRKCKLTPSEFPIYTAPSSRPVTQKDHRPRRVSPPAKKARKESPSPPPSTRMKSLSTDERKASPHRRMITPKTSVSSSPIPVSDPAEPSVVKLKHKAGPKKKARKVQELEFASGDDDDD